MMLWSECQSMGDPDVSGIGVRLRGAGIGVRTFDLEQRAIFIRAILCSLQHWLAINSMSLSPQDQPESFNGVSKALGPGRLSSSRGVRMEKEDYNQKMVRISSPCFNESRTCELWDALLLHSFSLSLSLSPPLSLSLSSPSLSLSLPLGPSLGGDTSEGHEIESTEWADWVSMLSQGQAVRRHHVVFMNSGSSRQLSPLARAPIRGSGSSGLFGPESSSRWEKQYAHKFMSSWGIATCTWGDQEHNSTPPWQRYFFKSIVTYLPLLSRYLLKSTPSPWQKVAYTPPICITIRLPFVLRYICRSIRTGGHWNPLKVSCCESVS